MKISSKQPINIYTESNPNPNSLKFVLNFMLMPEGMSRDFPDKESAKNAPLAAELLDFPYVQRVFYMSNFVTVTKDESVEWAEIRDDIKRHIKAYLEGGRQILDEEKTAGEDREIEGESDIEAKIKGVLDEYIRPAVEQDGGAIIFDSFSEGTVKVLLQGACSGCPSSTVTLKAGIENLLTRMIPEVKTVEATGI